MKQFWILLLALCLLLCACSKDSSPAAETTQPEAAESQSTEAVTEALPVVVTKHPTDEYLEYNWKTWFVAHADNATSVTWEFITPDGRLCSVNETVEMNPNLFLDVSKGDTIALEHAPLSLNGWSVQARFEGPGGSATTNPAKITVKQTLGAYDAIVKKYEQAANDRAKGYTVIAEYGVSEMIFYADSVAYALKNLDGVPGDELIIAGIGYDIPEEPVVFEIYTIHDGEPVSILCSYARSRYFLMKDGKIYHEGSSGAYSSNFSVMELKNEQLLFLNGLYTTAGESPEQLNYYFTTSNQYGDPEANAADNLMEEKVAQTFLDAWRAEIQLPAMSLIA